MQVPSCSLREAVEDDGKLILDWANDPETRAASFHSEPISESDHDRWFRESLDGARRLYIAEQDNRPIGLARLDPGTAAEAIVSLTIAPEFRGRGLGAVVLTALTRRAATLGISRLLAKIRKGNVRSQHAFERAGFERIGDDEVRGIPAVLYELLQSPSNAPESSK